MMDERDGDVATQLHRWALQEMHFHPQGRHINTRLPDVEHFRNICRGPMVDIWKFITSHVHSAQTVKKVHGNLTIKGKKRPASYRVKFKDTESYDKDKHDLLQRRAQLSGELTSVFTDVSHLETDLRRLKKEITDKENDYQSFCLEIDDLRRKKALLQMFSHKCSETVAQYNEYTNRIDGKVETLNGRARKGGQAEVFYSKETLTADQDKLSTHGLETACCKGVRETCSSVGTFLHQMLQGSFSSDKGALQVQKEQLWVQVEKVMADFSVHQVLHALVTNTQDTAFTLRETTSLIDIRKDAENLRFKYEKSGELRDMSSHPTTLQSVHQLLEERQLTHIQQFMTTEKHKNEAWKLENRLSEVKGNIDKKLQKTFSRKPGDLQLARTLVDSGIELAAERAALHCLNEEANQLREKIAQGMREKEIIWTKYQKIQDFKELASKKQNLIQILAKQNNNAQSRLDDQQTEILQYIQRSLGSHRADIQGLTGQVKGSVNSEVEIFTGLRLPYLMFSSLDSALKVAVIDLSIHHTTHPAAVQARHFLQSVLTCLGYPPFQAPEFLLKKCVEMKADIDEDSLLLGTRNANQEGVNRRINDSTIVSHISELCSQVSEHDRKQMEKVLPVLQQRIHQAAQALTECLQAKDTAQSWWEQPAQWTVQWVKVDDHNLQYWRDKWTVLVTRLRQLLVQQ